MNPQAPYLCILWKAIRSLLTDSSALEEHGDDESQRQPVPIVASTADKYGVIVKSVFFEVTVSVLIRLRLYIHSCQWPGLVRDEPTVAIKKTQGGFGRVQNENREKHRF